MISKVYSLLYMHSSEPMDNHKIQRLYPEVNTFSSSSQQDGKLGAQALLCGYGYGTCLQTKHTQV
ncbi:hypothetical protein CS542_09405 [Pedobacter sp. IW39]|nr:hypothetical protein CS542_09405 [Pedobacter sp. IW39]